MIIYSNEIVFRGHPDKACDQIAGAILDECLRQDRESRVAIECAIKGDLVFLFGELGTKAKIDPKGIVKMVLRSIGYSSGFRVIKKISAQSPDISAAVEEGGAGDQGMMFGYACDDTPECLPLAQTILIELAKAYDRLVHERPNVYFPDGKAQITGIYDDDFRLKEIKTFTISYQNNERNRFATDNEIRSIAKGICNRYCIYVHEYLFNPSGAFRIGGPEADSGLTGRKIVVDAYQSFANVGGGSMNGKDPTKVDVSGAYKARELAKRILRAKSLRWCEVQLSYAIGKAEPLAVHVDSDKGEIGIGAEIYDECRPQRIISELSLLEPRYEKRARYGHFADEGRDD